MHKMLLTNNEIKSIELNLLLEFKRFCELNNLRYYLAYGTLLGAIRHKGFIPWDDDIDVIMPRNDYEKFIEIYVPSKENFLLRSNKLGNFSAPFSKLVDSNTIVESKFSDSDIDVNLWIDIFPVDGLSDVLEENVRLYNKVQFYLRIFGWSNIRLGEGRTVFRRYAKYLLKLIARMYGKTVCVNNIEKLALRYSYENSNYVGMVTWASYGAKGILRRDEFERSTEVEFEGYKFKAMACWDNYLTDIYGDYMQLPPVEKRRTHNMIAYKII